MSYFWLDMEFLGWTIGRLNLTLLYELKLNYCVGTSFGFHSILGLSIFPMPLSTSTRPYLVLLPYQSSGSKCIVIPFNWSKLCLRWMPGVWFKILSTAGVNQRPVGVEFLFLWVLWKSSHITTLYFYWDFLGVWPVKSLHIEENLRFEKLHLCYKNRAWISLSLTSNYF